VQIAELDICEIARFAPQLVLEPNSRLMNANRHEPRRPPLPSRSLKPGRQGQLAPHRAAEEILGRGRPWRTHPAPTAHLPVAVTMKYCFSMFSIHHKHVALTDADLTASGQLRALSLNTCCNRATRSAAALGPGRLAVRKLVNAAAGRAGQSRPFDLLSRGLPRGIGATAQYECYETGGIIERRAELRPGEAGPAAPVSAAFPIL